MKIRTSEDIVLKGIEFFKISMGFCKNLNEPRKTLRKKKWISFNDEINSLHEIIKWCELQQANNIIYKLSSDELNDSFIEQIKEHIKKLRKESDLE